MGAFRNEHYQPDLFDCFAVSNHIGDNHASGHYTAYCRHDSMLAADTPCSHVHGWYKYNDQTVTPMDPDDVVSASAYILFYRRRASSQ